MKGLIKSIVTLFNGLALVFPPNLMLGGGNKFMFSWLRNEGKNKLIFNKSTFLRSRLVVIGDGNKIVIDGAILNRTTISVDGVGNRIELCDGVDLRNSEIIIRGSGCIVRIERNTTFGGIRIVNVGVDCAIEIGSGCLFSDHVELWASDTHPIYDNDGVVINAEKSVKIGDRVWVGSHVIILKGVIVADGSVVGMGSLVTRDVPENVISAGRPNKTIKSGVTWSLDARRVH